VILFPIYAISIWFSIAAMRRSWIGLAIAMVSAFPVLAMSYVCIQFIPLKPGEPRPEWLYFVSGAYAIVVAGIGLSIALSGRGRLPTDCHACGYDLRGVGTNICPECGTSRRCTACHAPLPCGPAGRCARCRLPYSIAPVVHQDPAPKPVARRATPRASFRRALTRITRP